MDCFYAHWKCNYQLPLSTARFAPLFTPPVTFAQTTGRGAAAANNSVFFKKNVSKTSLPTTGSGRGERTLGGGRLERVRQSERTLFFAAVVIVFVIELFGEKIHLIEVLLNALNNSTAGR